VAPCPGEEERICHVGLRGGFAGDWGVLLTDLLVPADLLQERAHSKSQVPGILLM